MALVKCHECANDVSTEADACPKCGAKMRAPKKPPIKLTIIHKIGIIIASVMIMVAIFGPDDSNNKPNTSTSALTQTENAAACRKDLQCWGDKNIAAVGVYCKDSIERQAKYSVKWTDGTFETKFSRFAWLNQQKGTIKYFGDKAQFQNGFGAYQNVVYECDFDPSTNRVLGINVAPGHL